MHDCLTSLARLQNNVVQIGELEEANAALEDMNTQMEASALQAETQRDKLKAELDSHRKDGKQVEDLEGELSALTQRLSVSAIICNLQHTFLCHPTSFPYAAAVPLLSYSQAEEVGPQKQKPYSIY